MLKEICDLEQLPIGHLLEKGHHLSCDNGHSYAFTTKTMAVGNDEANDGPSDAFLVTPIAVRDENNEFVRWDEGPVVTPLEAPYACPVCGLELGIK